MSWMIEKAARRLFTMSAPYSDYCTCKPNFDECTACAANEMERARAVIEEMREPTEAMEAAAYTADGTNMPLAITYKEAWQAMIDEALKP